MHCEQSVAANQFCWDGLAGELIGIKKIRDRQSIELVESTRPERVLPELEPWN